MGHPVYFITHTYVHIYRFYNTNIYIKKIIAQIYINLVAHINIHVYSMFYN